MSRYVSLPGALLLLVLLITSIVLSDSVPAGTNGWTGGGPEGGPISQLAVARSNPSIVYLSSEAGVFKSTDAGSTWESVHRVPASLHDQSLVVDPDDPDTVFWYSIENGVLRTTDGGDQWRLLLPYESNAFYSFVVFWFPSWRITQARYSRSTDGGRTWSTVDPHRLLFAFHPTIYGVWWTFDDGTLLKTSDNGQTFEVVGGLPPGYLYIDPANPQTMYAPSNTGLWKSTDGGQNWSLTGLRDTDVRSFSIDPERPSTLLATTLVKITSADVYDLPYSRYQGSVLRSDDGGATWRELPSPLLADDFSVPGVVFGSGHAAYLFNAAPGGVYSMIVDGPGPARQPGSRRRRVVNSTRSSHTVSNQRQL